MLDRCDFSALQDTSPVRVDLSDFDVKQLLPSSDLEQLYSNLATIAGRMLTEHVPGFAQYKCLVKGHIQDKHSEDMCKPSVVVSQVAIN